MDIEKASFALVSAFAAGFAVQQTLEILDALWFSTFSPRRKRQVIAASSAVLGLVFAFTANIRILGALGIKVPVDFVDGVISALFLSAGTDGVNSLLKFLQYKKEEQKGEAVKTQQAAGLSSATTEQFPLVLPAPAIPAGL